MLSAGRVRLRAALAVVAVAAAAAALIAQSRLERGELVRIPEVKQPAALKIVGLPDEIVEANESGVYIDDVAVAGFSREFLTRHRLARQYIPMDHYFVMGEERLEKCISEHLGIHPADRIERAQP